MISVQSQIQNASNAITQNIAVLRDNRELLSQNVLSQIRNLVEGVAVLFNVRSLNAEFRYDQIESGLAYVKGNGRLNFISRFHNLIQKIASHYTLGGDASERLMLKYYEYLYRIRACVLQHYSIQIIPNLESFPIDFKSAWFICYQKLNRNFWWGLPCSGIRIWPSDAGDKFTLLTTDKPMSNKSCHAFSPEGWA
jgi:hypothetical protein